MVALTAQGAHADWASFPYSSYFVASYREYLVFTGHSYICCSAFTVFPLQNPLQMGVLHNLPGTLCSLLLYLFLLRNMPNQTYRRAGCCICMCYMRVHVGCVVCSYKKASGVCLRLFTFRATRNSAKIVDATGAVRD